MLETKSKQHLRFLCYFFLLLFFLKKKGIRVYLFYTNILNFHTLFIKFLKERWNSVFALFIVVFEFFFSYKKKDNFVCNMYQIQCSLLLLFSSIRVISSFAHVVILFLFTNFFPILRCLCTALCVIVPSLRWGYAVFASSLRWAYAVFASSLPCVFPLYTPCLCSDLPIFASIFECVLASIFACVCVYFCVCVCVYVRVCLCLLTCK